MHYFETYRGQILALPLKSGPTDHYQESELKRPEHLLFSEADLDVYYAPFHAFTKDARVVLVGLTPGWTQMEQAYRAARLGMSHGYQGQVLHDYVDKCGSFSGPLRKHLVAMLDDIGLGEAFQLRTSDQLFAPGQNAVAFTSVISAPVFHRGKNFNGSAKRLFQSHQLRTWVIENLAKELASVPHAIVIPLGTTANAIVTELGRADSSIEDRLVKGFPHPSGANGHRKTQFERGRSSWREQIRVRFVIQPKCGISHTGHEER